MIPIVGRDEKFSTLCAKVRVAITRRLGAHASKELLMLLDLIELLGMDKMDRVRSGEDVDSKM